MFLCSRIRCDCEAGPTRERDQRSGSTYRWHSGFVTGHLFGQFFRFRPKSAWALLSRFPGNRRFWRSVGPRCAEPWRQVQPKTGRVPDRVRGKLVPQAGCGGEMRLDRAESAGRRPLAVGCRLCGKPAPGRGAPNREWETREPADRALSTADHQRRRRNRECCERGQVPATQTA